MQYYILYATSYYSVIQRHKWHKTWVSVWWSGIQQTRPGASQSLVWAALPWTGPPRRRCRRCRESVPSFLRTKYFWLYYYSVWFLPINQCVQLNQPRCLWLGEQRIRARNGCRKHKPTVMNPSRACGLVSNVLLSPSNSRRMRTNPAMVSPQVSIISSLCQMNHWSRLQHLLAVQVCL